MACKCGCEARAKEARERKEQRFYAYLRASGATLSEAEARREADLNARYGTAEREAVAA